MDLIPQDVWPLIISFLADKTKRLLRVASTKWFNIIKYHSFKLYFTRKEEIPAITERLSKYSWPLKLTFKKSKFTNTLDIIDYLPKLTNLIDFHIKAALDDKEVSHEQWMQLSVLTKLQNLCIERSNVPCELWRCLPNIETWDYCNLDEETLLPLLRQMSKLKTIYFDATDTWPFAIVPNPEMLTAISMDSLNTIEHGAEMWSKLTNLKKFVYGESDRNELNLSYMTSLEYLELYGCSTFPSLSSNTNLTKLRLECRTWTPQRSKELESLKKLRELELILPRPPHDPQQFQFLAHLPQLSQLSMRPRGHNNSDFTDTNNKIYPYLPNNLKRLHVTIDCDICQLTRLPNLESLDLPYRSMNSQYLSQLSGVKVLSMRSFSNEDFSKMTQLVDLAIQSFNVIDEINMPDLSTLDHLTRLFWGFMDCPVNKMAQLKFLTNLEQLQICLNDPKNSLDNGDFLANMTKLTLLKVYGTISKADSFWQHVSNLTKLQHIHVNTVDNDDRLLLLSHLTHLTTLSIMEGTENFRGIHLTSLTSLQSINYFGGTKLVHEKEDLLKRMPFLLTVFLK